MPLKWLKFFVFMFIIGNFLLINSSFSTSIELSDKWQKIGDNSQGYKQENGWRTYMLTSPFMGEIKINSPGYFKFAYQMSDSPSCTLKMNREILNSTGGFFRPPSSSQPVKMGDKIMCVLYSTGNNCGNVLISFPEEYFPNGEEEIESATTEPSSQTPEIYSSEPDTRINRPPMIRSFSPNRTSPQEEGCTVRWIVDALDEDADDLSYRYIVNKFNNTDWITDNEWQWDTSGYSGNCSVEVQVRDRECLSPNDTRIIYFMIEDQELTIEQLEIQADRSSPQAAGNAINFNASARGGNLSNAQYGLFINGQLANWSSTPNWTWRADNCYIGMNEIEVKVRDMTDINKNIINGSAKIPYDIGILVRNGDDLQNAIRNSSISTIYIDRSIEIQETLNINRPFVNIIGLSDAALAPINTLIAIEVWGDNFKISNLRLHDFRRERSKGINVSASNCLIEKMKISSGKAIHIENSNNTTVNGCDFIREGGNRQCLFSISNSSFINVRFNSFSRCDNLFMIKDVSNSEISNNTLNVSSRGIELDGRCFSVNIFNNSINQVEHPSTSPLSILINRGCDNVSIINNTIESYACDDSNSSWTGNRWNGLRCTAEDEMTIRHCNGSSGNTKDGEARCCNF